MILVLCGINTRTLSSQSRVLVPLTISGTTRSIIDTFGVHINATYCNDGQLDPDLEEREIPPGVPPTGFDIYWIEHRHNSSCVGLGQINHIQEGGKRDTFKLSIDWVATSEYPLTISWPHPSPWSSPLTISEVSDDTIRFIADMLLDSSVQVSDPLTDALLIIGDPVVLDVQDDSEGSPKEFVLLQNYPNPFNSSTMIRYTTRGQTFVTLRIYDLLGNEVATLVNGFQGQGDHTIQYNANALSSGTYLMSLRSGGESILRVLTVVK
jgi:hypothetical protein